MADIPLLTNAAARTLYKEKREAWLDAKQALTDIQDGVDTAKTQQANALRQLERAGRILEKAAFKN